MKKTDKILLVILSLCLIIVIISSLSYVFKGDHGLSWELFYEYADDIDVLFLGNSHAADYVPMELWEQYGVTSYNLASSGVPMPVTYWTLMNALDYASPKLVVLDCYALEHPDKTSSLAFTQSALDGFRLGPTKLKAVYDLSTDNDEISEKDRLGLFWPFGSYHDRWKSLSYWDFNKTENYLLGSNYSIAITPPAEAEPTDECMPRDSVGVTYLYKIIEECKARDINLLLVYAPFPAQRSKYMEANLMEEIAEECGVDCINFLDMELVDFDIDCVDSNCHLNTSGIRKIEKYMFDFILANYDIADHRGDSRYACWDEMYERFMPMKSEILSVAETDALRLMLLHDATMSSCVYIPQGSVLYDDEQLIKLVKNIPTDATLTKLDGAKAERSEYLLVVDNLSGAIHEFTGDERIESLSCSLGTIDYIDSPDGRVLSIDGGENMLYRASDGEALIVQGIVGYNGRAYDETLSWSSVKAS